MSNTVDEAIDAAWDALYETDHAVGRDTIIAALRRIALAAKAEMPCYRRDTPQGCYRVTEIDRENACPSCKAKELGDRA